MTDHNHSDHRAGTQRRDGAASSSSYDKARGIAGSAIEQSRDVARRASEGLESSPLGIVVGGLAVGALAGALIPRSRREKDLLAPIGRQIGARARAAIDAARTAGMEELDAQGVTRDAARGQIRGLIDGLSKAASTAGAAAAKGAAERP